SAAAARAAASCGVHGGQRRVFTCPGTGAFTRTRIRPRYEPLAPKSNGQWTIGSGRTHPADNGQILGDRGVHVVGIGLPVDHLLVLGAEVSPDPEVLEPLLHLLVAVGVGRGADPVEPRPQALVAVGVAQGSDSLAPGPFLERQGERKELSRLALGGQAGEKDRPSLDLTNGLGCV